MAKEAFDLSSEMRKNYIGFQILPMKMSCLYIATTMLERGQNLLGLRTSQIAILSVPVTGYQVKDFLDHGIWHGNAIYALVSARYVGLVSSMIYWSWLIFIKVRQQDGHEFQQLLQISQ